MKKHQLHPYYDTSYFLKRDLLDQHLAYTLSCLLKENSYKKVVDVGCGTGQLVRYLNNHGFAAYGCEPAHVAYKIAQKLNKPKKIYKTGASKLPFGNQSMDMVCAISVVEHLTPAEMDRFLSEVKRILRENGILFLVTPNYAVVWRFIHGKRWFGYTDPTHINFYTPSSLSHLLKQNGFGSLQFQFKTLYDPPYNWGMPGLIEKLPKLVKQLITFLTISSPLWRIRNSFWLAAFNRPTAPACVSCLGHTRLIFPVKESNRNYFFYECNLCGLIFIYPLPPEIPRRIYTVSDLYEHAVTTNPQVRAINRLPGGKRLIKIYGTWCNFLRFVLVTNIVKGGNLLDVGCGEGDFLQFFPKNKWNIFGIEVNSRLVRKTGKILDAQIYSKPVEQVILPTDFFDVVTLWHVFEHIRDPESILKKLARVIKPHGLLIIEVPNGQALYRKVFGSYWQTLLPPQHLYLWSEKSLTHLLQKYGYTVVKISYVGILSFSGASSFASWLRSKRVPNQISVAIAFASFPFIIFLNLLSVKRRENLQVVAQKQ